MAETVAAALTSHLLLMFVNDHLQNFPLIRTSSALNKALTVVAQQHQIKQRFSEEEVYDLGANPYLPAWCSAPTSPSDRRALRPARSGCRRP